MERCYGGGAVLMDLVRAGAHKYLKRLEIRTFMSHFQSFVQISKMLVEICVMLEDQFKRAGGGGEGQHN